MPILLLLQIRYTLVEKNGVKQVRTGKRGKVDFREEEVSQNESVTWCREAKTILDM